MLAFLKLVFLSNYYELVEKNQHFSTYFHKLYKTMAEAPSVKDFYRHPKNVSVM